MAIGTSREVSKSYNADTQCKFDFEKKEDVTDYELSKYQKDILEFFNKNKTSNIYVAALAGTGKTFMATLLTENSTTSDVYVAFNKHICNEMKEKIKNPKTKAYTMHGLGNMVMNTNLEKEKKKPILDNLKTYKIIYDLIGEKMNKYDSYDKKSFLRDNYAKLYNLARLKYIDMKSEDDIKRIVKEYILFESNEFLVPDIYTMGKMLVEIDKRSIKLFEEKQSCDFTDMLYITLKKLQTKEWEVPYFLLFTNIYFDEAQDTSSIQLFLIKYFKRIGGRFIFILDKNQAIYGFAASNCNSHLFIKKLFAPVVEFSLPINYRCPTSHLDYVNDNYNIGIIANNKAPTGEINIINKSDIVKHIKPADFLISRKNKWLVSVIIDLLKNNIPIFIKDADMVKNLIKTIEKTKCKTIKELDVKLKQIESRYDKKIATEKEKLINNEQDASVTAQEIKEMTLTDPTIDLFETAYVLLQNFKKQSDNVNIKFFIAYVEKMLNTTNPKECVICTSIHQVKGLETNNVFILNEARPTYDPRQSFDQKQQEKNLSYIALTRAKQKIYLVKNNKEDD